MIEVRALTASQVAGRLDEIAALRLSVFRSWPYLYHGDLDYERGYLMPYYTNQHALVVGALHHGRLVGISSAIPLEVQSEQIVAPFRDRPEAPETILYGGESLLLSSYRGRGVGGSFFDHREAWARILGRRHVAFCSVIRPANHPARPARERTLEGFWTARGYAPVPGAIAEFAWRDLGEEVETTKPLQFWMRTLP